jgi:hypothetical protein
MNRIYAIQCGIVVVGDVGVKGGRRGGNGQRAYCAERLSQLRLF